MIEILFFGRVADVMGVRTQRLALPAGGLSLLTLRKQLFAGQEDLQPRMSVNREIRTDDLPLQAGDEVAFFSVFSGG